MIRFDTLIAILFVLLAVSCENDSYDTGDGYLSDITTAFGETCYDTDGYAFKFVTDEDVTLTFTSVYGKPNTKLAGKESRSLLYYHITDDKSKVTPYAIIGVLATNVIDKEKVNKIDDDPLKVESVWMSPNKKYLNLSLKIKSSTPEDNDMRHKLGMIYEGDESNVSTLHLAHDNGGIPGNYTVSVYLSVRVSSITDRNPQCTDIRIKAMTDEGLKTFELKM